MGLFGERHGFIMVEKDVTTVLSVINRNSTFIDNIIMDYGIGNCSWADTPDMWFVNFVCIDKTYGKIISELSQIGRIKPIARPNKKIVDLYFEKY